MEPESPRCKNGLLTSSTRLFRNLHMNDPKDAPWGSVETHFERIHSAARMRDIASVRVELAAGVPVDILNGQAPNGDGGNTALWFAAQGKPDGGLEIVSALVEAGAMVNRQCEHGWTALHMAACWGHLDVVKFLVANGADWKLCDVKDRTPKKLAMVSTCVDKGRLHSVTEYLDSLDG